MLIKVTMCWWKHRKEVNMKEYISSSALYNHLIVEHPELCDGYDRRLTDIKNDSLIIGANDFSSKFLSPNCVERASEEIVSIDKGAFEGAKKFKSTYGFEGKFLCIIRGNKLTLEESKEIILATSCTSYKNRYEEYFNSHKVLNPLQVFELYGKYEAYEPQVAVGCEDIRICHASDWIHAFGNISKDFIIQRNTVSEMMILSDACNLALTFPNLDVRFYVFFNKGWARGALDTDRDRVNVFNFARSYLEHSGLYGKDFYSAVHVHDGKVDVLSCSTARKMFKKDL